MTVSFTCERLPFESAQFGRPVSRLVFGASPGSADARFAERLAAEIAARTRGGEYLMSCRLPEAAAETLDKALRAAGFVPVETLVTFERGIAAPLGTPDVAVAAATSADIAPCMAIGAAAFVHDRFHADTRLPKDRADALKGEWVRNDMSGRADACFVARRQGGIAGFVLCLVQGGTAIIDLIAVGPGHQRQGIGRALMLAAIARYAGPGRLMRAGTQEANRGSIALYHGLGFAPVARARTYHWVAA
ncbi:MAG TPA: GNAT family N-acetyltransferase [Alphaproteobacteria bacterium]